jgi:hypothetical protein
MNKKLLGILVCILFFGASVLPIVSGNSIRIGLKETDLEIKPMIINVAPEVWVDDDYYDGGYNDGHTWGYDAFDNIQDGVDNVNDNGIVHVKEGIFNAFKVEGRNNIDIIGEDEPIITGYQLVYDLSYPDYVYNIVFINNSDSIHLEDFHIIGTDPTPSDRDFSVFFQNSIGEINDCKIDANSIENMNGLAIRAISNSSLIVDNCLIEDYGRIAIYAKTGTTLNVFACTLIGQIYNVYNWVNYGNLSDKFIMFTTG